MDRTPDDLCGVGAAAWAGLPVLTARTRLLPATPADHEPLRAAGLEDGTVTALLGQAVPAWDQRQAQIRTIISTRDGSILGLSILAVQRDEGRLELVPDTGGWWTDEVKKRLFRQGFEALGLQTLRCGDVIVSRADWQTRHRARPQLLVVAAALIDGDSRVLLTSRPEGKSMAGLWEFPGGKVHEGETAEDALIRELREELAVEVGAGCLAPLTFASHDYDDFHLLMPVFAVRNWQGTPQPLEGQSLRWLRADQLSTLPMPPADLPLVAQLRLWL